MHRWQILFALAEELKDRACECFVEGREINPDETYPHGAECKMRINLHQRLYSRVMILCAKNSWVNMVEQTRIDENLDAIDSLLENAWRIIDAHDGQMEGKQVATIENLTRDKKLLTTDIDETIQICRQYILSA